MEIGKTFCGRTDGRTDTPEFQSTRSSPRRWPKNIVKDQFSGPDRAISPVCVCVCVHGLCVWKITYDLDIGSTWTGMPYLRNAWRSRSQVKVHDQWWKVHGRTLQVTHWMDACSNLVQCDICVVVCLIIYARVDGTTSSLRAFKLQYLLTCNILYVVADVEN